MFRPVAMIFAATLGLVAVPASADTPDDADSIAIGEAMDALRAKDFGQTVAKAQEIIGRFEAGRSPDTAYVCASGPGDTLTQLVSAAAAANEGSSKGAATTVALSPNVCDAYFLKGFALIDLGRRDEARPYLEAAVAMDPDNNHYANELGEWYKTGRQWEKSLEICRSTSWKTRLRCSAFATSGVADPIAASPSTNPSYAIGTKPASRSTNAWRSCPATKPRCRN